MISPLPLRGFFSLSAKVEKTSSLGVERTTPSGLAATAFVFFRPTPVRYGQVRRPDGTVPEVTDLAGA